eukprot:TRINITY_DN38485_c0_g1_i1.p1 TRINITY_DN38485_c0_g1~~TRINITY_DN38485_c0_g1_i1.p1  ORF type:complete len:143 (+),score=21.55 TRINITY_DN38485_c0_g1_i1:42-431(+)
MTESAKMMWDRYLEGLCSTDTDMLLQCYEPTATLRISNLATASGISTYTGIEQVAEGIKTFLKCIKDMSSFTMHSELVEEAAIGDRSHIFVSWSCASSGISEATDTIITSNQFKILSHCISYFQSSSPT